MGSGISSKSLRKSNNNNPVQINSNNQPLVTINGNSSSFQTSTSNYNEAVVHNQQSIPLLVSVDIASNNVNSIPSFIPYTPQGVDKDIYKYYCPLCMQYFKEMTKTLCCSNSICKHCILDYCQSKHMTFNNGINIPAIINTLTSSYNTIICPHCQVAGFRVSYVDNNDRVRDYSQSLIQLDKQHSNQSMESPLRIGESFENLKRKMIKFKSNNNEEDDNNNHNNNVLLSCKEIENDNEDHITNQLLISDHNYSTPRINRNIQIIHTTGIAMDNIVDQDEIPLTPYSNDGNSMNKSLHEDDILSPLNSSYHLSPQNSPLYISSATHNSASINTSTNFNPQYSLATSHNQNNQPKKSNNQEDNLESISLNSYDYNLITPISSIEPHQLLASILVKQMFHQVLNNHQ